MSRPFLPQHVRAIHPVGAKLTDDDYALLQAEAREQGTTPGALMRDLALAAIRERRKKILDADNG
jgi:hypothetical protein